MHRNGKIPDADPILSIKDLEVWFHTRENIVHAVNSVSMQVSRGEILGVVGESGCGKSVTMMSILGLLPSPPAEIRSGEALLEGKNLLAMRPDELRMIRGRKIGFIFQDPMTSLNPVLSVGFQLREPLRTHLGMSKKAANARAAELLDMVGIPAAAKRLSDFPHQFSGGMRQRVMIAMALACDPAVLIADEPTTALDVTIQAQILELLGELQQCLGMAIIWITHDLGVIAGLADNVLVMYAGQIVERAPVEALFDSPAHPYTKALLRTVPTVRGDRREKLQTISGQAPTLVSKPDFCPFMPRCEQAFDLCSKRVPPRIVHGESRDSACFLGQ